MSWGDLLKHARDFGLRAWIIGTGSCLTGAIFLLAGPPWAVSGLALDELVRRHRPWIGGSVLVLSVIFLTLLLAAAGAAADRRKARRALNATGKARIARLAQRLQNLNQEEQLLIEECRSSLDWVHLEPSHALDDLVKDGILRRSPYLARGEAAYTFTPEARKLVGNFRRR